MKDRIVTAAEHVFAQMGTEKATLRDITARAKGERCGRVG
jgi:AcrR family transcriptional regulator